MNAPPQLLGARRLRELLDRHGIRPAKALGQNFVLDPNTIRKMVELADIDDSDTVVEIGAGVGSLTLALAHAARRVLAVEFDRRLLPALKEVLEPTSNVEIVEADALQLDFGAVRANRLAGNLPYNIATPLVLKSLESAPQISDFTVMTQREVGERLAAPAGSKAYGHVTVMVRYFAAATLAARVSRRAFYPIPNVDSVIVRIVRRGELPSVDRERLFAVVREAFTQRRKTLRNCLSGVAGSADAAHAALRRAGIDPNARAENIDLDGFISLTQALA